MAVNLTNGRQRENRFDVRDITRAGPQGARAGAHEFGGGIRRAETPVCGKTPFRDWHHWMEYGRAKQQRNLPARSSMARSAVVIMRPGLTGAQVPGGWRSRHSYWRTERRTFQRRARDLQPHPCGQSDPAPGATGAACATDSTVFNVSDPEELTWSDYYGAICDGDRCRRIHDSTPPGHRLRENAPRSWPYGTRPGKGSQEAGLRSQRRSESGSRSWTGCNHRYGRPNHRSRNWQLRRASGGCRASNQTPVRASSTLTPKCIFGRFTS